MKTSELIENLSSESSTVKFQNPAILFIKWVALSVVYLALMLLVFGIRPDVLYKLQTALFIAELASLLLIALTVGVAAIILSYPDAYQKRYLIFLPIIPAIAFVITLFFEVQTQVATPVQNEQHMLGCFLCICILALGPAFLLFKQLMQNASTSPRLASAMAVLAAFSLGALTIRLSEKVDSMMHIIGAHYLPLLFLTVIGLLAGRKLLKW